MNKIEIPWVKVGERLPTNENESWEGQPCTPYVPCLVFIMYPDTPEGGTIVEASWDAAGQRFVGNSLWLMPPYITTHFIELQCLTKPNF